MSELIALEKAFGNWDENRKKAEYPKQEEDKYYLTDCPFCGSTQTRIVDVAIKYERNTYWRVKCDNCGAYGPCVSKLFKKDDAIKLWNDRQR
jgi:Lar family restriction alleviation protein